MGITANCSKFLFYSKDLGVNFKRSLTLGRLNLFASKKDISDQVNFFNNSSKSIKEVIFKDAYAEPLFEILGAEKTDSLDYSNYEKATIIHDLNFPVDDFLKDRFTAIVDGGTIEHVFNFPVAIKNCMEMLEEGGHYIGITPANNTMGHGFYQFSPELYYRVFSEENGFETLKIVLCAEKEKDVFSDWYEVVDPQKAQRRVLFTNDSPSYLMVIARKTKKKKIFEHTPQQSDYEVLWEKNRSIQRNQPAPNESKLVFLYRKFMPKAVKAIVYNMKNRLIHRKINKQGLGIIDPHQFKKIELKPGATL